MNREQALAALSNGQKVRRQGSTGHYRMEDGKIVFIGWQETVTLVTLGHWTDYVVMEENNEQT